MELEERLEQVRKEAAELIEKKNRKSPRPPPLPPSRDFGTEMQQPAGGGRASKNVQKSNVQESKRSSIGCEDESFEEVYERAMQMKESSFQRVEELKGRIELMAQEKEFIDKPPDTQIWRDLQQRLEERRSGEGGGMVDMEQVSKYIKSGLEIDGIREKEQTVLTLDKVVKKIRNEILEETIRMFSHNISKFMCHVAIAASKELNNIVFRALLGEFAGDLTVNERESTSMVGRTVKKDTNSSIGEVLCCNRSNMFLINKQRQLLTFIPLPQFFAFYMRLNPSYHRLVYLCLLGV